MTGRHRRWLDRALRLAAVSTCRQKHGAVVVKSGRVLAVGVNTLTVPVEMFGVCGGRVSVHAEVQALKQLPSGTKNATLYVARVSKSGDPVLSKPCGACARAIEESGMIREVVWS